VASPHQGRTVTIEKSADATPIRPFTIEIRQAEIAGLRARIAATRWPEKETVADQSQGVQLANIQEFYQAPRSWAEQAYANLIYFNEVDKGNHFAAWQEPDLFTTDVRAAFRSLR
jgi:Epoxide hydrolase N terminus